MDFDRAFDYFHEKGILVTKLFPMVGRSNALLKSSTRIIPQSLLRPDQMQALLRATC